MKSQSLILLTTIFSIIYFGLMKYIISQPWDGMTLFIIVTATCLFIGWLIISYISSDEITTEEDK